VFGAKSCRAWERRLYPFNDVLVLVDVKIRVAKTYALIDLGGTVMSTLINSTKKDVARGKIPVSAQNLCLPQ
jgi:hypothetical protein